LGTEEPKRADADRGIAFQGDYGHRESRAQRTRIPRSPSMEIGELGRGPRAGAAIWGEAAGLRERELGEESRAGERVRGAGSRTRRWARGEQRRWSRSGEDDGTTGHDGMMELGAKTRRQSRDLGSRTGACGGGSRTGTGCREGTARAGAGLQGRDDARAGAGLQ
jgi:hypothetical protein